MQYGSKSRDWRGLLYITLFEEVPLVYLDSLSAQWAMGNYMYTVIHPALDSPTFQVPSADDNTEPDTVGPYQDDDFALYLPYGNT